jgi:serine/threonine protein kinase
LLSLPIEIAFMAITSVSELLAALAASGVLDEGQRAELPSLGSQFPEVLDLARELVRRGWLTVYQLKQFFQGRSDELVLGQYVVLDLLGEGGMGQVFKARHRRLDRVDALKVIRPQHLQQPDSLRRFLREARAAARLSHPNIVTIYDADEANGTHFLAMEFVPGTDLSSAVRKEGFLLPAEACEYVRQAAMGLQHAHERGMVHRDVKPANLLRTKDRSLIKILDMGLARLHASDDRQQSVGELTHSGVVMGTPDYMAPEQAIDSHSVDIRADIYSLGCTLYFLLAGQPPFPESSLTQKLLWHQQKDPEPVRKLRQDLPAGLETVLTTMMAKNPDERYQSPGDVARALVPFVSIGGQTRAETVSRAPSKEDADFSISAPSVGRSAASIGGQTTGFDGPSVLKPAASLGDATVGLPPSMKVNEATVDLPGRRPAPPTPSLNDRTRPLPAPPMEEEDEDEEPAPAQNWQSVVGAGAVIALVVAVVAGAVWFLNRPPAMAPAKEKTFTHHDDIVYSVAFALDGKRGVSGGKDRKVVIWDLESGTLEARLEGFPDTVNSVAWSPVEDLVLIGGKSKTGIPNKSLKLWDPNPGHLERQRSLAGVDVSITSVAFSGDGKLALTGGGTQTRPDLRLWDVKEAQQLHAFQGHEKLILRVAFSKDGRLAASSGFDQTIRLWDVPGQKEAHVIRDLSGRALCLAFSPDGKLLASGGEDKVIRIWDLATFKETGLLAGHSSDVLGLTFTPDGKRLVSSSGDRTVRVWDVASKREIKSFEGHSDIVTCIAVSRDGTRALSGSQDKSVRLWQLPP